MLKFNKIFILIVISMLPALSFVSCLEVEDQQDKAVGYLSAPGLEVDLTVDDLTPTKAVDLGIEGPSEADILFTVKDKDGNTCYSGKGLWTEPLTLPVGAYTVEAVYGSNTFGSAYFTGSVSGNIKALDNETPALSMSLANSLVKVSIAEALAQHFIGDKIVMNSGAYEASFNEWFYVPSGSDISMTLVGTSSAGVKKEYSYTLYAPAAKTAYAVECGQSTTTWPSITMNAIDALNVWASRAYISAATFTNISSENQAAVVYEAIPSASSDWSLPITAVTENGSLVFKGLTPGTEYKVRARVGVLTSNEVTFTPAVDGLSVSAVHTYTNNELDGTDVTTSFSKSDLVKNSISSWTIKVCKADGTELRSHTALGLSDGSSFTGTNDWPYLPVGDYKVTFSATMNDGDVITPDALPFSTAAPSFTVTVSAYTSYDKYAATNNIAKDVSGANDCDPATLYNAGGKWGISTNLMKNANYAKTLVVKIDSDDSRTFDYTDGYSDNTYYENISGLSWASHNLTVSFTFDGIKVEKSQTHHITGLPYRVSNMGNFADYGWEGNNVTDLSTSNTASMAHGDNTYLLSPTFSIPSAVNVKVNLNLSGYKLTLYYDPYLYINATNSASKGDFKIEVSNVHTSAAKSSGTVQSTSLELNSSKCRICLSEYSERGNGLCAIFIHSLELLYD